MNLEIWYVVAKDPTEVSLSNITILRATKDMYIAWAHEDILEYHYKIFYCTLIHY